MKKVAVFFVFFCCFGMLFAQNELDIDAQLAKEYAEQGRIEESISIYQNLLKKGFNKQYYEELLQIFYSEERNKDAENLIKRAIKQNSQSNYVIDLGQHYLKTGDEKQAKKIFDRLIADMKANNSDITSTANLFMSKNNLEYAALTYQKGRELLRNPLLYTYELSFIYSREGKNDLIAQEYANLVENNPSMLSQVKIYLGNLFAQKDESNLIHLTKDAVVKRLQAKPENQSLFSLLVWIFMQENDYKSALAYAKALDKRLKEGADGAVMEVGDISLNNQDYATAMDAYKYLIINKGKDNIYYEPSLTGLLTAQFYEFTANALHSEKEKQEIETQYNKVLNEVGRNANTAPIMLQFANLLAYHLSRPQEAADMIAEVRNMPRIKAVVKAEAGLMLADILLMNGDVWGASLEYSKVVLEFKNDELGAKAKFAKARLSYFIADFQQAEIEFDALRSSTSKFIANDAMEYSLLIADNIDEDSTYTALSLYAKADLALYQHNSQLATLYLDSINIIYTYHSLFDEILYKRAEIAVEQKLYQEADSLLQVLVLKYPYDITADDALFLSAQINETYLANPQKAREYYERIILDYPSSLYVTQSRKRYQQIEGSKAEGI
ncbi:MAG: tetratricopeptide repeat protein [Bacteroidales bacterium]|jgi:predicted Zn-dependent protease|nr:tetratricopeptide repeat protein [Bacteroidales bacterium]